MIRHVVKAFPQHVFYVRAADAALFLPFLDIDNIRQYAGEPFDVLLTVGGSMFELGSTNVILNRLKTTVREYRAIRRTGKKIATIGCNLGSINRRLARFAVRRQLAQSSLITVRDSQSLEKLCNMGLQASLYPDMLFCSNIERKSSRSGLAISVYRSRTAPEKNLLCYRKYAEIADRYVEKTGSRVRLIAFDCENENDIAAAFTVHSMMKERGHAEIIVYTGEYQEIFDAVSSSECMLGTRFHSIVFSLISGVPALPVCYSAKTYGMLADIGYHGPMLDYHRLQEADPEKISALLAEPHTLLTLSCEDLADICEKARGHVQVLSLLLQKVEKNNKS